MTLGLVVVGGKRSRVIGLGRRAAVAFGFMATLGATRSASAQMGVGFPVTTMPSPTAPSQMPAPAEPESAALPLRAAPAPAPAPPSTTSPAGAREPESEDVPPPPHFGQIGQVVVSGQFSANVGFLSYDQSSASSSSASFEPAFEYFFADGLLLGGSLLMRYANETSALGFKASTGTFGLSARFGVNLPLSKLVSFQPVAGLGFWQAQTSFEAVEPGASTSVGGAAIAVGPDVNVTAVFVSLYAPLLVHPASHFFLGLGPEAFRDITYSVDNGSSRANTRRTFIGLSSIVGGWF